MKTKALILFAPGTNRDHDAAVALELAGAEPVVYPLNQLHTEKIEWSAFHMLVVRAAFRMLMPWVRESCLPLIFRYIFLTRYRLF